MIVAIVTMKNRQWNCVRTSKKFMIESLKDLDERMENKLNLMYGNYIDVIEHMKEKHGINGVYANTDYSPYAKVLFRFCSVMSEPIGR